MTRTTQAHDEVVQRPGKRQSSLSRASTPMGERFGNYEILRKIAAGGMAEVFLAKQTGIGGFERLVCIKRILPHLGEQEDFINMFQDEARIAANLVHPNIAQIYDIGRTQGSYYIAMEYVRGEDLRRIYNQEVARGRAMPLEPAAQIIMGGAAGLDVAHRQSSIDGRPLGIVHRDVSPQNILVTYDGHVKIVDFGVAKASGKLAETRIGVLKGKYSYMSPEQAAGDPIDARTDIFALGITLYEVTTGVRLFKRETELETLHAVIDCKVARPSEIIPRYDRDFEAIVMRALAHSPEDRYQTSGELMRELEKFLVKRGHPTGASSLGPYMQDLFAEKLADDMLLGGPGTRQSSQTPAKGKSKSAKSDWGVSSSRSTEASTKADEVSVSASDFEAEPTDINQRRRILSQTSRSGSGEATVIEKSEPRGRTRSTPQRSERSQPSRSSSHTEARNAETRGSESPDWGAEASIAIDPSQAEIPGWERSESRPKSTSGSRSRKRNRGSEHEWGHEASQSESKTATQAVPELAVQNLPGPAELIEIKHDRLAAAREIPVPAQTPWLPRIAIVALVFGVAAAAVLIVASHRRSFNELPRSGALAIDSEPRGARVVFYGLGADALNAHYDAARTPFSVSEGIPTDAMLEAEFVKEGYVLVKKSLPHLDVNKVPEPLFAELTAEAGTERATLVILSAPNGAEVFVDGERRGLAPITDLRVEGGTQHKIEMKMSGYAPHVDQLYVEPGERRFVEVTLLKPSAAEKAAAPAVAPTPTPSPKPSAAKPIAKSQPHDDDDDAPSKVPSAGGGKGFLTVEASVPLKVYAGDRLLGDTPLKRASLDAGQQKLRFVNDKEGISITRKVRVTAGSTESIDLKLRKGSLAVNVTPWAWVRVGSRPPVETPTRLDLYEGDYTVKFECPDGKQIKDTAHIVGGKTSTLAASCR